MFDDIKTELRNDKDFLEATKESNGDKILADLGVIEVVTKDDKSKTDFYKAVARQLDSFFAGSIQTKFGGAISLIDVFLYYNRARGADLITADDLLHALRQLPNIDSSLELKENPSGIKVIQLKV